MIPGLHTLNDILRGVVGSGRVHVCGDSRLVPMQTGSGWIKSPLREKCACPQFRSGSGEFFNSVPLLQNVGAPIKFEVCIF